LVFAPETKEFGLKYIGTVNFHKQLITLATGNKSCGENVLHESIHAIDRFAGVDLSERDIIVLSTSFYAFMRDNPELIKAIIEEE